MPDRVHEWDPKVRGVVTALEWWHFEVIRLSPGHLLGFSVEEVKHVAIGVHMLLPWPRVAATADAACGSGREMACLVRQARVGVFIVRQIFVRKFVDFVGIYEGLKTANNYI